MSIRNYINNASVVTITGALTNVSATCTVTSASTFPTSFPYTGVLDAGLTTAEVVLVTAAAGNVLTITRGYDGTAAQSHAAAATFQHVAAKIDYAEANAHINATAQVHGLGVGSGLVGTLDAQTLTNKTLTSPVLNTPVINNGGVVSLPAAGARTLVARDTTDTLTNKTLTGAVLDATSTIGGVSGTSIATFARGRVGSASTTTAAAFNTVEAILTTLADISFTAVAGRRYKVTVTLSNLASASATSVCTFRVVDGGASAPTTASTLLYRTSNVEVGTTVGNNPGPIGFHFELTGLSAGTHRLGVTAIADVGAPVVNNSASASSFSTLTIEDIGV